MVSIPVVLITTHLHYKFAFYCSQPLPGRKRALHGNCNVCLLTGINLMSQHIGLITNTSKVRATYFLTYFQGLNKGGK